MENRGELVHYGILGMKWGVRRTEAQLARARGQTKSEKESSSGSKSNSGQATKAPVKKSSSSSTSKKKSISEMSDDELNHAVRRLQLEKQYRDLNPQKVSAGKKFVNDVILPAVKDTGRNVLRDYTNKKLRELLKLDDKDSLEKLKKEVQKLTLEKSYENLKREKAKGF